MLKLYAALFAKPGCLETTILRERKRVKWSYGYTWPGSNLDAMTDGTLEVIDRTRVLLSSSSSTNIPSDSSSSFAHSDRCHQTKIHVYIYFSYRHDKIRCMCVINWTNRRSCTSYRCHLLWTIYSMELPWETFYGISVDSWQFHVGKKYENSMRFHVKHSTEFPWNNSIYSFNTFLSTLEDDDGRSTVQ